MKSSLNMGTQDFATFSAHNLQVFRGKHRICTGLNFTVSAGETLEVIGANGTGKTSLLRVFAGLSDDYTGNLLWRTHRHIDIQEHYLNEMTYIAHKTAFKDELSVRENLQFYAQLKSANNKKCDLKSKLADQIDREIDQSLNLLGIATLANTSFGILSEGQRRRAALARLPLEQTTLWLLDEPTATLDTDGVANFEMLLNKHSEDGGIAIIATHQTFKGSKQQLQLPLR